MATRNWRGDAVAVAQVNTWVFAGTSETNDIIKVTINGKVVQVTTGSATIATYLATLLAALQASTIPEFTEITWSVSSPNLVGTAVTAGLPFVATVTLFESDGTTPGDSQTVDGSTSSTGVATTACTGPNHWDNAANWSSVTLPVDGDTVIFADSAVDCLYGATQAAVTPAIIRIDQSYTGKIGLPVYNTGGYYEYRTRYLAYCASGDATNTVITIGNGSGAGSQRMNLDTGDGQVTMTVNNTGPPQSSVPCAVHWKGTHASNVLTVNKGSIGVARYPSEVATIATLRTGFVTNQNGDAKVYCGSGVTLTTIYQSGGYLQTESNIVTVNFTDGEWKHLAGTVTTINGDGGNMRYLSTGTFTTLNGRSGFNADFRQDQRGRTGTNINLYEGIEWHDPQGTVTATNGYDFIGTTPSDKKNIFDVLPHQTWTPSAI